MAAGCLSSGTVALTSGNIFAVEVNGTTACTLYDQLQVSGTVTLGNATLSVTLGYTPAIGDAFTILTNDGTDAVTGTFSGLAEGARFSVAGTPFAISYAGGDGNDIVLTVQPYDPPAVALSINPSSLLATSPATMSLTLTNPNTVALTNAAFSLPLPSGLVVASPNALSSTCGAVTATEGSSNITLSGGTIAPGTCTISVNLTSGVAAGFTVVFTAGALTTSNSAPSVTAVQASVTFRGIVAGSITVEEGLGTRTIHRVSFPVTNPTAVAGGFTIPYSTSDVTAVAGVDYRSASGTLTFAGTAGETQNIPLEILGDEVVDPGETFRIDLGTPSNPAAEIADSTGSVTLDEGTVPASFVYDATTEWTIGGSSYFTNVWTGWMADHPEAAVGMVLLWDIPTNFGGCVLNVEFNPMAPPCPAPMPFVYPTPGEDASAAFQPTKAVWQTRSRLKITPRVIDTNEELVNVDFALREGVARRDDISFVSAQQVLKDFVTIDTKEPVVVSITPSLTLLNDANAGGTLSLTIVYSEPMHAAFAPAITFAAPATTTLTAAGGSWADNRTYTALFTITDADAFDPAVTVTVAGARDNYPIVNGVPLGNPQVASATPNVFAIRMSSAPTASLSITPTESSVGSPVTATLTFANSNSVVLSGAAFDLALPPGLVIASPSGLTSSCGSVTALAGSSSIQLTGGALPPGTCTISVSLTSATPGIYSVTFPIGALTTLGSEANAGSSAASVSFNGPPLVSKSFSPPSVAPGATSKVAITLTNGSPNALTSVAFTDTLPANVVVAVTPNATNTCTGSLLATAAATSVTLTSGQIPAGGNCVVTFDVTPMLPGSFTNVLGVGSVTSANAPSNTSAAQAILVGTDLAPITNVLNLSSSTVARDVASTLSITWTNPNLIQLSSIGFAKTLPSNLFVASPSNAVTSCGGTVTAVAGSNALAVANAVLAAGATCTVQVDLVSSTNGTYNISLASGDVSSTPIAGSTASSTALTVLAAPAVALAFAPGTVSPGVTSTATITLSNTNAVPLTGASLTAMLPANVVVTSTPANSCGGTVTGTSNSVALSGGIMPAGGLCTLSFDVVSSQTGTHAMTIAAGDVTTTNGGTNALPATAQLTVTAYLPLVVAATFDPVSISPGGISTMTIAITNPNAASVSSVGMSGNLPAGLTIAPSAAPRASFVSSDCGGTIVATGGSAAFSLSGGRINPSSLCTVSMDVIGNVAGAFAISFPAGSVTSDQTPPSNAFNAVATLIVAQVAGIPTLTEWVLVALALAVAAIGVTRMRAP